MCLDHFFYSFFLVKKGIICGKNIFGIFFCPRIFFCYNMCFRVFLCVAPHRPKFHFKNRSDRAQQEEEPYKQQDLRQLRR